MKFIQIYDVKARNEVSFENVDSSSAVSLLSAHTFTHSHTSTYTNKQLFKRGIVSRKRPDYLQMTDIINNPTTIPSI